MRTPSAWSSKETEALAHHHEQNVMALQTRIAEQAGELEAAIVVMTLASLALAAAISFLTSRSIAAPIVQLAGLAERVGNGELGLEIRSTGRGDEVGALWRSFAAMVEGLRETTQGLQEGVANLTSSVSQIAATAKQTAASATEQGSTVAEVTTTIEEVGQTSKSADERAKEVVASSDEALQGGQRGVEAVESARRDDGHHHRAGSRAWRPRSSS